mgnify:CR=1 FL=1
MVYFICLFDFCQCYTPCCKETCFSVSIPCSSRHLASLCGRHYGFGPCLCLECVDHDCNHSYSGHSTQDTTNYRTNRRNGTIWNKQKYLVRWNLNKIGYMLKRSHLLQLKFLNWLNSRDCGRLFSFCEVKCRFMLYVSKINVSKEKTCLPHVCSASSSSPVITEDNKKKSILIITYRIDVIARWNGR